MTFVLWMTGLPCSGKTTIARNLKENIPNLALLDGDELREWFSPKDFSREGRNEHNKRVAHLANLLIRHKVPACVSLISPFKENRDVARKIIGTDKFIEIFINCSLEECEKRDVKGMYKKARKNEIKNFTGISDPYDIPDNPQIIVDSQKKTIDECVQQILNYIKQKKLF